MQALHLTIARMWANLGLFDSKTYATRPTYVSPLLAIVNLRSLEEKFSTSYSRFQGWCSVVAVRVNFNIHVTFGDI